MGSRHDLVEFGFAKSVVKDFPQIKADMEALRNKLLPLTGYAAVAHTVQTLNESLELIEVQYSYYTKVLFNKGR